MIKRNLLLFLVICITFIGGFLTGTRFPHEDSQNISNSELPQSSVHTEQKQIPRFKETKEKVLLGYLQDYRDPSMVPYRDLTHVIFSFAHPTNDGGLLLNGEMAEQNLTTVVSKAHEADTKAILAIGGWYNIQGGESYPYFREAISSAEKRTRFIKEINKIVDQENLDGIDIDFEHPRTLEDARNLATFMKDLNQTLDQKNKELSIAVSAKVHSVAGTELNNVIYDPAMFQEVDHVNIMAYDGQWDGEYDARNLSPYSFNENIVNYWTRLFEENQLPKEKLVLGIPSYGQPEDPSIKQVSYAAIIAQNPQNANSDRTNLNGTVYHYNGTAAVRQKAELALSHGFGGMMLWEVGLDAKGPNSLTETLAKEIHLEKLAKK